MMKLWSSCWDGTQFDLCLILFSLSYAASPACLDFLALNIPSCLKNATFTSQLVKLLITSPKSTLLNNTFKGCIPQFKRLDQKHILFLCKGIEELLLDLQCKFLNADTTETNIEIMTFARSTAKWLEWDADFSLSILAARYTCVDAQLNILSRSNSRQSTFILALLIRQYQALKDCVKPWTIEAVTHHDIGIDILI